MIHTLFRAIALCTLAISAVFAPSAGAGDALERVIDFQELRVGMSGNQPPLSMIGKAGGAMGFDVDLARLLAGAMQVKLDLRIMPFGELMDALEKDEIDMVISGLAITPQRTERVSFVGPYMMSGKSILTRSSTLGSADSTDSFNSEDVTLLALKNSTSASFVRRAAPDAKLSEVESYDQGIAALLDGKADAMVADMPMCVLTVLRYPEAGFTTLEEPLTVEPIGIAVGKEDRQFINLVQNYLTAYEKTGVLNKIRKRWFEDSAWLAELP